MIAYMYWSKISSLYV